MTLCAGFSERVQEYACEHVVCLFLARLPRRVSTLYLRAAKNRERHLDVQLRINEFLPVVGVLWPVPKIHEFLAWIEENPRKLGHIEPRSDDSVTGRWSSLTHQTIRFSIPSLVQHEDLEPSLIGRKPAWGRDSGRVAILFE